MSRVRYDTTYNNLKIYLKKINLKVLFGCLVEDLSGHGRDNIWW